jgi:hypothetical protein
MVGILSLGDVSNSAPGDLLSECVRNVSAWCRFFGEQGHARRTCRRPDVGSFSLELFERLGRAHKDRGRRHDVGWIFCPDQVSITASSFVETIGITEGGIELGDGIGSRTTFSRACRSVAYIIVQAPSRRDCFHSR